MHWQLVPAATGSRNSSKPLMGLVELVEERMEATAPSWATEQ